MIKISEIVTLNVSNLIKFYNRKPINVINDITIGYSDYPFSFREILKKHGHKIITSVASPRWWGVNKH